MPPEFRTLKQAQALLDDAREQERVARAEITHLSNVNMTLRGELSELKKVLRKYQDDLNERALTQPSQTSGAGNSWTRLWKRVSE